MIDLNKELTEHELHNNTIKLCKDCSDERKNEWQKKNKNLKISKGNYVKLAIKDKNGTEHLWFQITFINGKSFIGKCDNTPVVIEKLKYNDSLTFKFEDIEDYIK